MLRHLHLPGLTSYSHASRIQERLVSRLLAHKAAPSTTTAPDPVVITAHFHPVYTCGRREVGTVSQEQQDFLQADGRAEFKTALRGGQTTFHGPGQLVAYPIIDLKRHGFTARSYVCLLEKTLKKTCGQWGIKTMTTENPGVWVDDDSKIAALGVHMRRNVSSHGIGLNVNTDLWWFGRIVACGLEGKKTTSFEDQGVTGVGLDQVANAFVKDFSAGLGGTSEITTMTEDEID